MTVTKSITKPTITIIVAALVPKFGIGYKGSLPWRLSNEMKYFRQVTTATTTTAQNDKKNVVIMGRKTWESIPKKFRPLNNRINVVLTRDVASLQKKKNDQDDQVIISGSIQESLQQLSNTIGLDKIETVYIIGGAQIYNHCLEAGLCDQILLTEVYHHSQDNNRAQIEMDTFLNIDETSFKTKWKEADLANYLEQRNLHKNFQLKDNQEGDFKYDFKLFEKI